MELEYIQSLVTIDFGKLTSEIISTKPADPYPDAAKEYDPETHRVVTDYFMRPDKVIEIGTEEKPEQRTVHATRLPFPFQQRIVRMRATFLCGNPVQLDAKAADPTGENLIEVIKKTWDDNKLDYKNKQILKILMSEMEVAELWYPEKADAEYWDDTPNKGKTIRFRVQVLAKSKGDSLYPVFGEYGDMVAFGRQFVTKNDEKKDVRHFDIYTPDVVYYSTEKAGGYSLDKKEDNSFKKIQLIYGWQPLPEWAPVKRPINQYEVSISDHTDSNGYMLDPLTLVKGKVLSYSQKGEKGGIMELEADAEVSLLQAKQETDSRELEQKNLRKHIMDDTSTPDISFEQMKGLGDYSYIALRMFFLDAHMAAADKEEIFGEYMQRRINLLKAAHVAINPALKPALVMKITPKFDYYMPKNDDEKIGTLNKAVSGGILSKQSATEMNPLIEDAEEELQRLQDEAAEEERKQNALGPLGDA